MGGQANRLPRDSPVGGDDGTWVPDIAWADVPADASGSAEVDYVVPETWWGKTLQLSVMGLSSGLMATTTFTDGNSNVNFNTTGLPAGTSVTVNYNGTNNGGNPIMGPLTFNAPGPAPAGNIGTQGGSSFSFTFPARITVGSNTYDLIGTSTTSPFNTPNTGPPTPLTPITGNYQLHVVTPTNNPPVITCLNLPRIWDKRSDASAQAQASDTTSRLATTTTAPEPW